ncbi:MAG: hypothetical protein HYS80_02250, partial [Candidatus Aenigmarchaeota archaeon]|nr:hypothetical protein [Candidatus Aenigmarchaeota archaeon]
MAGEERVATNISGLDPLLEGGFIRGSANLVAGTSGTCKTIFCCQFLWNGLQKGENGIYVTLEESPEDILANMKKFGWDFEKFIKSKKFNIVSVTPGSVTDLASFIFNQIKGIKA